MERKDSKVTPDLQVIFQNILQTTFNRLPFSRNSIQDSLGYLETTELKVTLEILGQLVLPDLVGNLVLMVWKVVKERMEHQEWKANKEPGVRSAISA